ncbi:MAG: sugar phosphate isomerase/epimerase [Phycisphaerales bacterium]|nr:sugar phosphate isomerase/epimerase [Phycisphaerales bacterium]
MNGRLGVCSWSLQPASPADLAWKVSKVGVQWVQLALDPISHADWDEEETVGALKEAKIGIVSGMIGFPGEDYSTLETIRQTGGVRPDADWEQNLKRVRTNAALAEQLGLQLVTLHAGFLPHEKDDPERPKMLDRLRAVADAFEDRGVAVGLETGQESATTLLEVLGELDRPSVGVNFDPANMALYGMGDPVEALRLLLDRVVQVHIKDARPTRAPGEWGTEVTVGEGVVDWKAFFNVLRSHGRSLDMLIEREAGDDRVGDAITARELVERHLPGLGDG